MLIKSYTATNTTSEGLMLKNIKVENPITILMLTCDAAFSGNESIHVRFQNSDATQTTDIINPMQLKNVFPHIGVFNQSGVIVNADGSQTALITLADGNLKGSENRKLLIDLTQLQNARTYTLKAIATEKTAERLARYIFGNLDSGIYSKDVNLGNMQSMAIERTFTDLTLTSIFGETQTLDPQEAAVLELFMGYAGKVAYDGDVTGYVKQLDNYYLTNVTAQRSVTIKNSAGDAAVAYSLFGFVNGR